MAILSKLKIKEEEPLWLLSCPPDCLQLFEGYDKKIAITAKRKVKQVVFFAGNKKELDKTFSKLAPCLAEDAVCWIAYLKKSSGIPSDLMRDEGWEIIGEKGYHFVTSVSINDNWTGMRIRKPDHNALYKRDVPMAERKTPGIDYVKRTVTLPADALNALKEFDGLAEFFYNMSFSHKKEYVEAIEEAKKTETRQKRIDKMIEALLRMKEENELKKRNK